MGHIVVPDAEKLLDQELRVLDRGFVRLVDYMGGDDRIVQTARVSYGEGTKSVREDAALIDYLLRHQHTSPFEHVIFEFHCKLPIFVARQWIRHRTARLNELSGRYSVMADEFYLPPPDQIRRQSTDNKQGRSDQDVPPELQHRVLDILKRDQEAAYATYEEILKDDIARELARINLPLSLYTQWYWQMDLHNLLHFLALRLDAHAQWEIRQYAQVLARIVKAVCPLAYASFERHILKGCRLSEDEVHAVRKLLAGEANPLTGRRLGEFEAKFLGGLRAAAPSVPAAPHGHRPAHPSHPETVAGLRVTMGADEINQLPQRQFEGPVHLIRDDKALAAALKDLRREPVLGFDTESRPSFRPGQNFPVSIVQLSTAETAYIIQLRSLEHPETLFALFEDGAIRKVGVALDQDLSKLRQLHAFVPAGFVDVGRIATRLGLKKSGLRGMAAILLGWRVSKGAQRSNWAREDLTPAQIAYAATDAWISRELYLALRDRQLTEPGE